MKRYSQNNEQDVILEYLAKHNLTQGKLLEIGAFDGEAFSNVRAIMLKHPGWSGVFVEPSSYCFAKLIDLYKMEPRRAQLVNLAVLPEDELDGSPILKFYDSPMSGVSSTVSGHAQRWYNEKNADGDTVNPRQVYVGKVGMREVLSHFGSTFDFINVDVEGYSARLVMQDWFDPRNYNCKIICIEQDGRWQELQTKFFGMGYSVLLLNAENLIMAKL